MRREAMENGTKAVCPELRAVSDGIDITEEGQEQLHKHGRLSLFESRFLPSGKGKVAFVGGPVSALDFHPWAKGICAIAAHRSDQETHKILKCYEGSAHIQLWRFSKESTDCIGVIEHNGDCVWDLKWRPDESDQDGTAGWRGTVAAALGDGTVLVCYIDSFAQTPVSLERSHIESLSPRSTILRVNKNIASRSPVRVVEWSKDGNLLVAGAADGSIEVYDATSVGRTWPRWSIPGHESVVMDLRWLSDTHLCSLGLSCVLRLRDIRDPVSTLEQNMEGLSGSLSMDTPEPNVAVVGGDYGYLRVVRLSGADGVLSRHPVKRVRLQAGSFRDMRSIPVSGRNGKEASQTLLYTGGADGMLHECKFPRPIWESAEHCELGRTRISEKLRWELKKNGKGPDGEHADHVTLHLQVGGTPGAHAPVPKKQPSESGDAASEADGEIVKQEVNADEPCEESPKLPVPRKSSARRSRALGRAVSSDSYSLFGSRYNQSVVISRIGLSAASNMLAVGISGGVVTWMHLSLASHERGGDAEGVGGLGRHKVVKPPRKRGRPRKFPILPIQPPGEPTTEAGVDMPRTPKTVVVMPRTPKTVVVEEEKAIRRRGRPRQSPVVFGPKRKRGRPRKVVADAEEKEREVGKKRKRTRKLKAQKEVQREQEQAEVVVGTPGGISDDAVLVVKDIETSAGVVQVPETMAGDGDKKVQEEHDGLELEIVPTGQKAPGTGRHGRLRRRSQKGRERDGVAEAATRKEAQASAKPKARTGPKSSGKAARKGESRAAQAAAEAEKEKASEGVVVQRAGKEHDKVKEKASGTTDREKIRGSTPARRSPRGAKKGAQRGEEAAAVEERVQNRREEGDVMMTPKRDVANSARTRRGKKRCAAEGQAPIPEIGGATPSEKRFEHADDADPANSERRSNADMEIAHPGPPQHANSWPDVAATTTTPPPPPDPKMTPSQQQERAAAMDIEVLSAQAAPTTLPLPAAKEEMPALSPRKEETPAPTPTKMEMEPASPPPAALHGEEEAPPSPPTPPTTSRKRHCAELESDSSAIADASVAPDTAAPVNDARPGSPSAVASRKRQRVDHSAHECERTEETKKPESLPLCPCRLRVAPARKEAASARLRVRSPAPALESVLVPADADLSVRTPRRSVRTRVRRIQVQEQPAPRPPRAPRRRSVKLRLRIVEPVALTDDSDMDDEPPKSVQVRLRIRPGAARQAGLGGDAAGKAGSADAPAKATDDEEGRKGNGDMDEELAPPAKTTEGAVSASAAAGDCRKDDGAEYDEGVAASKAAEGVSTADGESRKNDGARDNEGAALAKAAEGELSTACGESWQNAGAKDNGAVVAKATESDASAAGGESRKDGDGNAAMADANGGMDTPAAAEKDEGKDQPTENGVTAAEKHERPMAEDAPFQVPDVGGKAEEKMAKAATALISMGAKDESANVVLGNPGAKVTDVQPGKEEVSVPSKDAGAVDESARVNVGKPDAKVMELRPGKVLLSVGAEVEAAKVEIGRVDAKVTDAQSGKDAATATANASEAPAMKRENTLSDGAEQTTEGSDGDGGRHRLRRVRKPSWKVA